MKNLQHFDSLELNKLGLKELNSIQCTTITAGSKWPDVWMDSTGRLWYFFSSDNGKAEYHPSDTFIC